MNICFIRRLPAFFALLCVGLLALSRPAVADDYPRFEAGGGYAWLRDNDLKENFAAGWFASVGGNFSSVFGIVGEASGNYKTLNELGTDINLSVYSFMAGPKLAARQGQVTLFAQVLFGGARAAASASPLGMTFRASETDFAYQPGAGLDINLGSNLGLRLGANYRFIRANGSTGKQVQAFAGLVFRTSH